MELVQILQPSAAGLTLAAAAIVAGAPLFSSGMRAMRLRKNLRHLREFPLGERPAGFAHVRGKVALESPLFAPISAAACAGFELEVRAEGLSLHRVIGERRKFRIEDRGASALIGAERGRWAVAATGERAIRADQPLSEALTALLARVPESLWWRRAGGTLHLVEHALRVGVDCHVVGLVRPMSAAVAGVEWARTGTDDARAVAEPAVAREPDLWIGHDGHLDFLLVSDQLPRPEHLHIPARHAVGVLVGPALSLSGMLYLAAAADYLRSLGRF